MKVSVKVDKDKTVGKIKPMHCVNNLPDGSGFFDHYIAEAQIPYCRLHDSVYIHWKFVDIHAVFPDFDADEQDPASICIQGVFVSLPS